MSDEADDPTNLTEFVTWIRERRLKLPKPTRAGGFGWYDYGQGNMTLREFSVLVNLLAPPKIVADILKEFDLTAIDNAAQLNAVLARAEQLLTDAIAAEPVAASSPPPVLTEKPISRRRRRAMRDALWLQWYEDETSETCGSPAAIRDRWNREHPEDPVNLDTNEQGRDTIWRAIKRAKERRDGTGQE
jgi:hypothetical protein